MEEASKRGDKLKMSEEEFLHCMNPLRSMAPQLKSWVMKHKQLIACFGTCENHKEGTCQLTDWTGPKEKASGQGSGLMSARF